jgi:ribonuclease III
MNNQRNNLRNKFISQNELEKILTINSSDNSIDNEKYTIPIHNAMWYKRSFALQCFVDELNEQNHGLQEEKYIFAKSNETLEIVGDSVIGCIVVEYLEERFCDEREGFISMLKMYLTKTEGLCYFATKLGFRDYMLLSTESENLKLKSELEGSVINGRDNPDFLENCFEAFIGALFTDYKHQYNSGKAYEVCQQFLVYLIESYIDFSEIILRRDNYKNILQHHYHTKKWPLPTYVDLKMENDKGDRKIYTRGIYLPRFLLSQIQIKELLFKYKKEKKITMEDSILVGVGVSYKKKAADQLCAKDSLSYFCPEELDLQVSPVL